MPVQHDADMKAHIVREGVERRLGHTKNLMLTIFDFNDGPHSKPELPYAHLKHIFSAFGGGVSPETLPENIDALLQAARDWKYP